MTSGKVLREARERKGYDLTTVARRLRIRPDILRAIEAGDFSSMPPRGYARNMVNAYARFLGLNPTEIVNMYLDDAYAYQVERARGSSRSSGFDMRGSRRSLSRERGRNDEHRNSTSLSFQSSGYSDGPRDPMSSRSRMRHLYDDRTQYSRDDYGVTRERVERPGRSDRDFLSHHSGYTSGYGSGGYSTGYGAGYGNNSSSSRRRSRDIHVGQTPMQYSASRMPAFLQSRGVLLIAALVVLAIIVVVFMMIRSNAAAPAQDDVSQLPVSGISDTTGGEDAAGEQVTPVEIAPTSAMIVYRVASGDDCYVEIYSDGTQSAEMLSGPVEKTVETTGTWTITTWSPDTISVTVNGSPVTLETSSDYGGMYAYTVDFSKILEEWRQTHTSRDAQRQAAVATASNAASQPSSSSSSAAADDGEGEQSTSQVVG